MIADSGGPRAEGRGPSGLSPTSALTLALWDVGGSQAVAHLVLGIAAAFAHPEWARAVLDDYCAAIDSQMPEDARLADVVRFVVRVAPVEVLQEAQP